MSNKQWTTTFFVVAIWLIFLCGFGGVVQHYAFPSLTPEQQLYMAIKSFNIPGDISLFASAVLYFICGLGVAWGIVAKNERYVRLFGDTPYGLEQNYPMGCFPAVLLVLLGLLIATLLLLNGLLQFTGWAA